MGVLSSPPLSMTPAQLQRLRIGSKRNKVTKNWNHKCDPNSVIKLPMWNKLLDILLVISHLGHKLHNISLSLFFSFQETRIIIFIDKWHPLLSPFVKYTKIDIFKLLFSINLLVPGSLQWFWFWLTKSWQYFKCEIYIQLQLWTWQ